MSGDYTKEQEEVMRQHFNVQVSLPMCTKSKWEKLKFDEDYLIYGFRRGYAAAKGWEYAK